MDRRIVDPPLSRIRELATKFRAGIDRADTCLPDTFSNFPRGCCGEAALLLAKYLEENGCGRFDYVPGWRDGRSHAWLRRGDLVVDITGNQFLDMTQEVIVAHRSTWHASFEVQAEGVHAADFEKYDDDTRFMLGAAYRRVRETLDCP